MWKRQGGRLGIDLPHDPQYNGLKYLYDYLLKEASEREIGSYAQNRYCGNGPQRHKSSTIYNNNNNKENILHQLLLVNSRTYKADSQKLLERIGAWEKSTGRLVGEQI